MATEKEQREIEIILNGQKANASLKEMGSAAALMNSQLRKMSEDDPKREQLIKDFRDMRQKIADTRSEIYNMRVTQEDLAKAEEELHQKNLAILKDGTQLNASFAQMKTAASLMEEQLDNMFSDDPEREKLKTDLQQLRQRMSDYKADINQVVKSQEELEKEQQKLHESNLQIIVDGKKLNASLDEMKASAAAMEKQLHSMAKDDPNRKKMIKDFREMSDRIEEAKQEMAGVQKASLAAKLGLDGVTSATGFLKLGFKAAVAAFLPLLAFQEIVELGRKFLGLVDNVDKVRGAWQRLGVTQGHELNELYARTEAIVTTFNKEQEEVIKTANVVAKEFGISYQAAFDLIEKGFLAGGDASGEMLEQIKEYSSQFANAKTSAEEMFTVLVNSENRGVFSDKGMDVVKEFGLRIREQTTATRDALDAAFGQDFTDKLFKGLNEGSISSVEALKMVSKQMNDTEVPAKELQTVIADVFGGPGEDAGIEYLRSLENIDGKLDDLIDKSNALTEAQRDQLEANKELAEAEALLGEAFSGTGSSLDILWTKMKTFGATIFADWLNDWKVLKNEVNGLMASLSSFGSSLDSIWTALQNGDISGAADAFSSAGTKASQAYWGAYVENMKQEWEDKKKLEQQQADEDAKAAEEKAKKEAELTRAEKQKAAERQQKEEERQLKKALEDYKNAKAKAELETARLKVEIMEEGVDKVLAKLRFQHEQEIKEIENQRQKVLENVAITEQEKQALLDQYQEQQRMKEEELKLAEETALEEEKEAKKEKFFEQLLEEEEYQALALEEQFLRTYDAEYAREQALLELHKQTLEQKLAFLKQSGEGETKEALKVKNELLTIEKDKVAKEKALVKDRVDFENTMSQMRLSLAEETLDGLLGFMKEESAAYQIFKALRKTLSVAEIIMNLEKELAFNAVTAAANPLNAVTGGAAGAVQLKIANTLSSVRAGLSIAKVVAFEKGGYTNSGKTIPMAEVDGAWQMLSGHSGGSIGAFADGGWVNNAQLGLIGEAGRELVLPNWMVESPKYANIVGWLEQERQKGIKAFASGGSTGDALPAPVETNDRLVEKFEELLQEFKGMKEEVSTWPSKLEVHNNVGDTRKQLQVLNALEERAFG